MNWLDNEWRIEVRKHFGINLMPEMYVDVWRMKEGRNIAIKIQLRRSWEKLLRTFGLK